MSNKVKKGNEDKHKINTDSPLILKSGASDLRRQEKTLVKLIADNYQGGIKKNNLYGFSNGTTNVIKILKINEDNNITMLKLKRGKPFPWPPYKEKGTDGYTITLVDEKKKMYLNEIGCPENL